MRKVLEEAQLDLGDLKIEQIVPGCPDDQVRSALDLEYEAWLPSRERHAPGSCPGPQPTEAQDRPRVRRRAQYARVQREYIKNGSRCAQDVISGAWQDPPISCLWRRRKHSGEVFLSNLRFRTIGVRSLWGRQSGNLWPL